MNFKRKEITCENCLAKFEFEESDIHGYIEEEEYELYVTCPYCDEEVELESVEDYGFWPEDIIGDAYDKLEPKDDD